MMTLSRITLGSFVYFLASCASIGARQVELKTVPEGAVIRSVAGEELGKSPLQLSGDGLTKAMRDGRLKVIVAAPGYSEREVSFDVRGDDSHEIRLTPLDTEYFEKHVLHDFSPQLNQMTKDMLNIQGLVIAKRLPEAEKAIESFQKAFPNVAASYVMAANVELIKGQRDRALANLLRARSIDPKDAVIARMLAGLGQK